MKNTTRKQAALPASSIAEAPARSATPLVDDAIEAPVRKQKLGEKIARQIIFEIKEADWKAGKMIGTEPELLARYGVSRATFREAVRQVEQHGIANMRRGSGGGLIVSEPPIGAAIRAMVTYLELTRVSFLEQHEVREQLEMTAARLACERLDAASAADLDDKLRALRSMKNLSETVSANMAVRVAVANATRNPAIALFVQALNGVMRDILKVLRVDRVEGQRDRELSGQFKEELVAAILARDAHEAQRLVRQDVQRRLHAMVSQMTNSAANKDATPGEAAFADPAEPEKASAKLGERVALAIVDDIEKAGWEVGRSIGNETELQQRHSVSRAVLREAIRKLELHGVAQVKSGVHGGLVIGKADPTYTEEVVVMYLQSTGISTRHLWELQSTLSNFAAAKLAESISAKDCATLRTCIKDLHAASNEDLLASASYLHVVISDLTGNRALALFTRILNRYAVAVLPTLEQRSRNWQIKSHERLVEAICSHDAAAARAEMEKIFQQSFTWLKADAD